MDLFMQVGNQSVRSVGKKRLENTVRKKRDMIQNFLYAVKSTKNDSCLPALKIPPELCGLPV